jgi:hypothetical protein
MVNVRISFIWIALAATLLGCSTGKIGYEQASKLFRVGMSPAEVEKVYGKPQFQDELGDFVLWVYPPTERISVPEKNVEEFRGFQITFRDNKTTKIAATWSVEKHQATDSKTPENSRSP